MIKKEIIVRGGIIIASLGAGSLAGSLLLPTLIERIQSFDKPDATSTAVPTMTPEQGAIRKAVETAIANRFIATPVKTETPRSTETPVAMIQAAQGVSVNMGFPDKPNNTVETATDIFKNTIGLGTEAFAADPGGLLVGPDFGSKSENNPFGFNPIGWDAMYGSRGHIVPLSPDTQHSFTSPAPAEYLLAKGGWVMFAAPELRLSVEGLSDVKIDMAREDGVGYLVFMRGPYTDHKAGNARVKLESYMSGATLGMRLPAGSKGENQAFWSQGQVKQIVENMGTRGPNCTVKGCEKVRVVYFDYNTRAFGVWEVQNDTWKLVAKNY